MQSVAHPEHKDDFGVELVRDWGPGEARAVVVLVHGIGEHSGRYEHVGSMLSETGFHVRSFDLQGHGASGGPRVDIPQWDVLHDQIRRHVVWAEDQGGPVILMGHSMGGTLAAGYVQTTEPGADLLVLSAPAFSGGASWQRLLASGLSMVAPKLRIATTIEGEQLSRDPAVGDAYFADPLVYRKATVRFAAAFFAAMDAAKEGMEGIQVPTLVLHGGADTIVPPQSTADVGALPNVDRRLYPKLRHEIMNEPEGPEVVADIVAWLDEHL